VIIDGVIVDFENKQATKDWKTINITNEETKPIRLLWDDIVVDYQWQLITIKQNRINVSWNKWNNHQNLNLQF
jgi:hypothetical protein